MKKAILSIAAVSIVLVAQAEKKYEPTWESLDSRETPQ